MSRKPTKNHLWILSSDLLFRPTILEVKLKETISIQIHYGYNPLISIAYAIEDIMEAHTKNNLEPILESLKIAFQTTYTDLFMLRLGFRYVVSTAILTILCKDLDEQKRVPHATCHLQYSENEVVNKIQTEIIKDLRSTINLHKLDSSGVLIFQFLIDNTPIDNQYFMAGVEMATVLFSGLSQAVQVSHPQLHWPSPAQNFTIAT